jgi:hypothetical protein
MEAKPARRNISPIGLINSYTESPGAAPDRTLAIARLLGEYAGIGLDYVFMQSFVVGFRKPVRLAALCGMEFGGLYDRAGRPCLSLKLQKVDL